MRFVRRGNFRGAAILPDAEISMSALVLAYIVWRTNLTVPSDFSAQVLSRRLYFGNPPEFS